MDPIAVQIFSDLAASLVSIDDTLKLLLKIQCVERNMTLDHLRAYNPDEEGEITLDDTPQSKLAALLQEEQRRAEAGEAPLDPQDIAEMTEDA